MSFHASRYKTGIKIILVFILTVALLSTTGVSAGTNGIASLVQHGGLLLTRNNQELLSYNPDTPLTPASIAKITTSLAAMHLLGRDYRFQTEFYYDSEKNLYIKGYGDPFLISEEISVIVQQLQQRGLERINDIYIDESAFQLTGQADGVGASLNPYDVTTSALVVNFNTINITVAKGGKVVSAEPQTPTIAIMTELGKNLPVGDHRINITQDSKNSFRYVGELFRAFQIKSGIKGSGVIKQALAPGHLKPVYVHSSSMSMEEIIRNLMEYSNNFVANQLFLACGAKQSGYPATWDKSRQAVTGFIQKQLGLTGQDIIIDEGSGISRKNMITPKAMIKILEAFKPDARLLHEDGRKLIKSGTMIGVYSYAGYFMGQDLDPFVLILNQQDNNRDRLMNILEKVYADQADDKPLVKKK